MNSSEEEDGTVARVGGKEGREGCDELPYGAVLVLHSGRDEKIGKKH